MKLYYNISEIKNKLPNNSLKISVKDFLKKYPEIEYYNVGEIIEDDSIITKLQYFVIDNRSLFQIVEIKKDDRKPLCALKIAIFQTDSSESQNNGF